MRASHLGLASTAIFVLVIALAPTASAATVTVTLSNGQFQPANPHIDPGDTVMFSITDTQGHDVIFEDGIASGTAGAMAPGQNWTRTFNDTGVFEFRCQAHSADFIHGMVGVVLVGDVKPPPKSPGFEIVGALAAVGAAAVLAAVARRH